jgi:hypothetical protein
MEYAGDSGTKYIVIEGGAHRDDGTLQELVHNWSPD